MAGPFQPRRRLVAPLLLAGLVALPAGVAEAKPRAGKATVRSCANTRLVPNQGNLRQVTAATMCLVNRERELRRLRPLTTHNRLAAAALAHSRDMVARQYFAHVTPEGLTVSRRVLNVGYVSANRSWSVGENLAWGTGRYATPASRVTAWMNSPGHRANMLYPGFREGGVGVALDAPARVRTALSGGTYTILFGVRR
jgi:uncharacterized protein YkwD